MEIYKKDNASLPEQVAINQNNIDALAEVIKDAYKTTDNTTPETASVLLNTTNIPENINKGYIISANGNLYNITLIDRVTGTAFIEFYSTILGPNGPRGAQGATGPMGLQGVPGPTGAQGPIGPAGPQGERGLQGPQGIQGEQGLQGPAGPQGPQGERGETGAKGDAGNDFTIVGTVSNVSELPASAPAGTAYFVGATTPRVIYAYDGIVTAWINQGYLQGPKGDRGEQGIQGVQGLQGPTGPQGPSGPAGAKGDQGATGPAGAKGDAGPTGATGPQGPQGIPGNDGQGYNDMGSWVINNEYHPYDTCYYGGSTYVCVVEINNSTITPNLDTAHFSIFAQKGAAGPQGAQGATGPTGATGPQGPAGATGADAVIASGGSATENYVIFNTNIAGYNLMQITGTFDAGSNNDISHNFPRAFGMPPNVVVTWQKNDSTTREWNIKGTPTTTAFTMHKNAGDSGNRYSYIAVGLVTK